MTALELKPCPFCGGEATIVKNTRGYASGDGALTDDFFAMCKKCKNKTALYSSDVRMSECGEVIINKNGAELAIEVWNRRAQDDF